MDHEYRQILKTLHETELSMADNEKMLAEYKRKLPDQCKSSDYVLQQIRNDVESVKASIQQYDFKLSQISCDPLRTRVAAIEQQMNNSSGTVSEAMDCLRQEMSKVFHMQSKLMEEMKLLRDDGFSKIDELCLVSRYVDENKHLQSELMKQMIAKDRLMADYINVLNNLKKEKEICLQCTKENEMLLEEIKGLKDQKVTDNGNKTKKLKQHVLKLKLELVEKESLLQQENDKCCNMKMQLTRALQKLDKTKQKYSDTKSQLDKSIRVSKHESNPQYCSEWNMELQVLLSTLDGLVLTSDNCPSHNSCSLDRGYLYTLMRHPLDYGFIIRQILDKITLVGHILTQTTAEKRQFEEQLLQAKQRNKMLKDKLMEFKEELLF